MKKLPILGLLALSLLIGNKTVKAKSSSENSINNVSGLIKSDDKKKLKNQKKKLAKEEEKLEEKQKNLDKAIKLEKEKEKLKKKQAKVDKKLKNLK